MRKKNCRIAENIKDNPNVLHSLPMKQCITFKMFLLKWHTHHNTDRSCNLIIPYRKALNPRSNIKM